MESEQQGHPEVDPTPDPDVPTPAGDTPAPDTTPPGGELPVPEGSKVIEDDPNFQKEQEEEDAIDPSEGQDQSVVSDESLTTGLQSPSSVPPDGDDSKAENQTES